MPRKLIRRYLPDPDKLRAHRSLRVFARWLHHPNLWHINRRGVSVGIAIGLFCAFLPMPLQMIPSTAVALALRANIPAAVGGVWVTNPLTMAPAILLCHQVGAWILGVPARPLRVQMSWGWLTEELVQVWEPFLLGCAIVGTLAAALGYYAIQLLWRWHVVRAWEQRAMTKNGKLKMKN